MPYPRVRVEPFVVLFAVAAFVLAAAWAWQGPRIGDEWVHHRQILRLAHGDFSIDRDHLTTIPGYHALVATFVALTGAESLGAARWFNAVLAIGAVAAFMVARRAAGHGVDVLAAAQLAVLPALFPFFFLAYTDVLSLALLLAACAATLRRRHLLAGIVLIAAMAVRQNNVVWVAWLGCLAAAIDGHLPRPRSLASATRVIAPYAAGIAAFIVFWIVNGTISLSPVQAHAHPDFSVHMGNVVFALALAAALLPLQTVGGLVEGTRRVRRRPWLVLVPLLLATWFAAGFVVDHPYNLTERAWSYRDHLLQAAQAHAGVKAVLVGLAVSAACGLACVPLRPRVAASFVPFAAVGLALAWLIETRYAIVPIVLWLVFREHDRKGVEVATFAWWLLASAWLFFGVMDGRPFV